MRFDHSLFSNLSQLRRSPVNSVDFVVVNGGPQDCIYKALHHLDTPAIHVVRQAFKVLGNSIEVAKGTVTNNTALQTLANLNDNEPAYKLVMLVKGWVHHLKQGWLTGCKGKGKKAPPAPLDPPALETGSTNNWASVLSGVRWLEKRICHTLMGQAMVHSQHQCYKAYRTPLPTI